MKNGCDRVVCILPQPFLVFVLLLNHIIEPCVLFLEIEVYRIGRAVAVLGNNDIHLIWEIGRAHV